MNQPVPVHHQADHPAAPVEDETGRRHRSDFTMKVFLLPMVLVSMVWAIADIALDRPSGIAALCVAVLALVISIVSAKRNIEAAKAASPRVVHPASMEGSVR